MELDSTFHWSTSSELVLFQVLARHKPAGINKHFSMAIVVEELVSQLTQADRQVTSDDVWAKLRTMYDLAAVDDREERIPFPLDEREFSLPRRDFALLVADKQREILKDRKEGRAVAVGKGQGVIRMGQDMGGVLARREGSDHKPDPEPAKGGPKRHATRSTPSSAANTP